MIGRSPLPLEEVEADRAAPARHLDRQRTAPARCLPQPQDEAARGRVVRGLQGEDDRAGGVHGRPRGRRAGEPAALRLDRHRHGAAPGERLRTLEVPGVRAQRVGEAEVRRAALVLRDLLEVLVVPERLEGERLEVVAQEERVLRCDGHASARPRGVHEALDGEPPRVAALQEVALGRGPGPDDGPRRVEAQGGAGGDDGEDVDEPLLDGDRPLAHAVVEVHADRRGRRG